MKYYCASSSSPDSIKKVREFMSRAAERGHEATHDWTIEVEHARASGLSEETMSRAAREGAAEADARGVEDSEALVYLAPAEKSEGSAFELGMACYRERNDFPGHGTFITIVVGKARCIFTELARYHVETFDEALDLMDKHDARKR